MFWKKKNTYNKETKIYVFLNEFEDNKFLCVCGESQLRFTCRHLWEDTCFPLDEITVREYKINLDSETMHWCDVYDFEIKVNVKDGIKEEKLCLVSRNYNPPISFDYDPIIWKEQVKDE